jgi:hypothetical protein
LTEGPSHTPQSSLGARRRTIKITIRQVLGHLWGPHNECVLVVDADIGGTVRQTMHIVLGTESEAQVATAILNAHGHQLELPRPYRPSPVARPIPLNGAL